MEQIRQNYYGNLCTEMYEILHSEAPSDELDFYLSYAEKGKKILEPLCGSGRFLVPFLERGFTISGIDLSEEMLAKLKQKAPMASVACRDILQYSSDRLFDYIFISSSSVSLFTDISVCRQLLGKMKSLLSPDAAWPLPSAAGVSLSGVSDIASSGAALPAGTSAFPPSPTA